MENQIKKLKISAYARLSPKRLAEVQRFVRICKRKDGFEALFYWDSIKNRKNLGVNEILCYTEDETLVGYLALYHFEDKEVEITLLIHPEYRNRRLYVELFEQVKLAMMKYSVRITGYIFSCNQKYNSLKEYLSYSGGRASEFTYKLALTPKRFLKANLGKVPDLTLRRATKLDLLRLIEMELECYPVSAEPYKNHLLQVFDNPNVDILVLIVNDLIIGKIHVYQEKQSATLYDFCIARAEQKKGYGTALLNAVLANIFENNIKKILVDVTDNFDLNWYKRFNFKCIETYEHWKITASISPVKEREKQLETLLLNFHSVGVQNQLSQQYTKH